jgi:hypothetical protein
MGTPRGQRRLQDRDRLGIALRLRQCVADFELRRQCRLAVLAVQARRDGHGFAPVRDRGLGLAERHFRRRLHGERTQQVRVRRGMQIG